MHAPRILAAVVALAGCSAGAPPEDAASGVSSEAQEPGLRPMACTTPPAQGDPAATSPQREGIQRLNCHRDLMGLAPAFLDPELGALAQAHADYVAATGEYGHVESQTGHPLFTGVDAVDRADALGVAFDPQAQALLEVVSFQDRGADPPAAVDRWVDSVYHRPPIGLPTLDGVGIGSADVFDVMEVLAPWEGDGLDVGAYPGDGQRGIPTSFDTDRESPDPDPERGVVGYPVTLSFLMANAGGGGNPYGIEVDRDATRLDGPDGEVPCTILEPADDDVLLRTVALLPHDPLAADTTYTATVVLELAAGPVEEQWSFTTGR